MNKELNEDVWDWDNVLYHIDPYWISDANTKTPFVSSLVIRSKADKTLKVEMRIVSFTNGQPNYRVCTKGNTKWCEGNSKRALRMMMLHLIQNVSVAQKSPSACLNWNGHSMYDMLGQEVS